MPTERQVMLPECVEYVQQASDERRIQSVIVHHTWRPTAANYRGLATVRSVRRYHMQVRGWSDNGYHIMIGPPGDIFLCRPLSRVGAHCQGQNQHSVGLAYIADFDVEDPAQYPGLQVGQEVVAALLARFDLGPEKVRLHREYASKTCPGTRLDRDQYLRRVTTLMSQSENTALKVVLLPGSQVLDCHPRLEAGTTRVDLRPVAEALGCELHDHIADQAKVYLRRKVQSLADLQRVD